MTRLTPLLRRLGVGSLCLAGLLAGCSSGSTSSTDDRGVNERIKDYGPGGYNRDKAFFPAHIRVEVASGGRREVSLFCTPEEVQQAIGPKSKTRDWWVEVQIVTMYSSDPPVNGKMTGRTVSQPYRPDYGNPIFVGLPGYYSFQLVGMGKELSDWTTPVEVK